MILVSLSRFSVYSAVRAFSASMTSGFARYMKVRFHSLLSGGDRGVGAFFLPTVGGEEVFDG